MWGVKCPYIPWSKILPCVPCPHKIGFWHHRFVAWHQPKVNDHIFHILYHMTHGTEVTTCEHPQH